MIVPAFKNGARIADKETVIAMDGYAALEQQIMRMMRDQGSAKPG